MFVITILHGMLCSIDAGFLFEKWEGERNDQITVHHEETEKYPLSPLKPHDGQGLKRDIDYSSLLEFNNDDSYSIIRSAARLCIRHFRSTNKRQRAFSPNIFLLFLIYSPTPDYRRKR